MHDDGLPLVVAGPISWRPSATSRSERMPSDATGEFPDALEQPTRLPSARPTTNDHSLSLFIVSLSRQKLSERFSQPEVCEHDQVKTRLFGKPWLYFRANFVSARGSFLHDAAFHR